MTMAQVTKTVELTGGPPWGFRLGAVTLAAVEIDGILTRKPAIKISRVNPGSKSALSGLRDGDLILSVNGDPISTSGAVVDASADQGRSKDDSMSSSPHQNLHQAFQASQVSLTVLAKKSKKHKRSPSGSRKGKQTSSKCDKSLSNGNNAEVDNDKSKDKELLTTDSKDVAIAEAEMVENGALSTPSKQEVSAKNFKECKNQQLPSRGPVVNAQSATETEITDPPTKLTPLLAEIIDELQMVATNAADFLDEIKTQETENTMATPASLQVSIGSGIKNGSLLIKKEDLLRTERELFKTESDEIPPVWTPPSIQSSPQITKKTFRPINFNASKASPTTTNGSTDNFYGTPTNNSSGSQNLHFNQSSNSLLKPSHSSSHVGFDNSGNTPIVPIQHSLSSSNLPRYQSPTVTLLQKAREGQLPKGAAYLEQSTQGSDKTRSVVDGKYSPKFVVRSYADGCQPISPTPGRRKNSAEKVDIPLTSKSTLSDEKDQKEWYKRMYESLHVERKGSGKKMCSYPAAKIKTELPARSFWAKRVHSSGTMSEPEESYECIEYDYNKFGRRVNLSISNTPNHSEAVPPGAIRFTNPGRIEDYNPGDVSSTKTKVFYRQQPNLKKHWALASQTASPSGYDSDTNFIIKKKTADIKSPEPPPLSPAEQRQMYLEIQKGGEVPLQGLRKFVNPNSDADGSRTASPSNIKYNESTVNIHYKAPVRLEEKEYVSEEELRRRQQEELKKKYAEQYQMKLQREFEDIERRRHSDNFIPSQKSPIPLNRYENGDDLDGLIDNRPRGGIWQRMTPEPTFRTFYAQALYDFKPQNSRELCLLKGDILWIKRKIDSNWYEGVLKSKSMARPSGATGIFPCSYVQALSDDWKSGGMRIGDYEGKARALYNFKPSTAYELELTKGEMVYLTRRVDSNWFEGRRKRDPTVTGIFPVNYVDVIKEIGAIGSKSPVPRKPIGQPVSRSFYYTPQDEISPQIHHYKPNDFVLPHDESDYGELFEQTRKISKIKRNPKLELITIDTRLNNDQPFRYRAIYNYKPVNSDELELAEGDIVEVMEKCDDGWFVGTSLRTRMFGTFPGNYVERI